MELINRINDVLQWADDLNSNVFRGHSQPLNYMKTLGLTFSELVDDLNELSKEQLITMIVNFNIMEDDIMNIINDEVEKE